MDRSAKAHDPKAVTYMNNLCKGLRDQERGASKRIQETFKEFDKDKSGLIDMHEWISHTLTTVNVADLLLRRQLKTRGDEFWHSQLEFDSNGDGYIGFDEFSNSVQQTFQSMWNAIQKVCPGCCKHTYTVKTGDRNIYMHIVDHDEPTFTKTNITNKI
jgi:Ca2+-binding EF-hand superfamily protein